MAKSTVVYVCHECGADSPQWQGQCPSCSTWNSLQEMRIPQNTKTPVARASRHGAASQGYAGQLQPVVELKNIPIQQQPRIQIGDTEFDRVLGGGLVPGSVVLIGGNPGAGKSTLLLQTLGKLAFQQSCLYVTGEESLQQIALRAQRVDLGEPPLQLVAETRLEAILALVEARKPAILVVDSIQVVHLDDIPSAPGSVAQVKECAAALTRMAKQTGTCVILVGHVTKEGMLAGPKVLEHIIDCSLLLESSQNNRFRILRSHKNRFGAVNEIGVFAMVANGLKAVKNPSALFLSQSIPEAPGTVITTIWEGTRAMLIEVQALVDDGFGGPGRRLSIGIDSNRLNMLLAVLHKQAGVQLGDQDVYVNLVGGLKTTETGIDLAVLLAVVASFRNSIIPRDWLVLGEVGLTGEIRPIANGQERLIEAAKQGFKKAIVPKANIKCSQLPQGMDVVGVITLQEALCLLA